jgi:uracil-DNA glycosylase
MRRLRGEKLLAEDVRTRETKRRLARLKTVHFALDQCSECKYMIGPVVHGPPVLTPIMLVGQAPGPREGEFGRPFAWTAGKTLFQWLEATVFASEEEVREKIYMAAVCRCFPGKADSSFGGDRRPDAGEVAACRPFLEREVAILKPRLVLAIGQLAMVEVMGARAKNRKLDDIVGTVERNVVWHGVELDVIALPHPSGISTWHKVEPGKTLLKKALTEIHNHPVMQEVFGHTPRDSFCPPSIAIPSMIPSSASFR